MTARWRVESGMGGWLAFPIDPPVIDFMILEPTTWFPMDEWDLAVRFADHHARRRA